MFIIPLKNIDSDVPLERFIIQHYELEDKDIAEHDIKKILDSSKCLLVFDGYDEYKKGTNPAIDEAISGQNCHSFVLITSRQDYTKKKDRKKLGEIQINGLSDKNIKKCIDRYFDKDQVSQQGTTSEDRAQTKAKGEEFIKDVKKQSIYGLLRIPILLLMLSILFVETGSLPKKRTAIIWDIIKIYIKRAEEKGHSIENRDKLRFDLGKLSYAASQRDTHQLLIKKV